MTDNIDTRSHVFTSPTEPEKGKTKTHSKDMPIQDYKPSLVQDAAKVDPLDDRAFKNLIFYREKALMLLINKYISSYSKIDAIAINGNIILGPNSKEIMMDSLFEIEEEKFINVEGQKVTSGFPLKRHLAYWSAAYNQQLKRGVAYNDMLPAVSIVVYKNRASYNWYDEAKLGGDLAKEEDYRNPLLQLVAINTNNWHEAISEEPELGSLLYLLHNGIDILSKESQAYEGIDINSPEFRGIYSEVFLACTNLRIERHKEEGDEKMVKEYQTFLSDRQIEEVSAEYEARGKEMGKVEFMIKYLNFTPNQIASELKLSLTQVQEIITKLKEAGEI